MSEKPFTEAADLTRQRTLSHYTPRIQPERENFDILDWGDAASQQARFQAFSEVAVLNQANILDIGCGLADLRQFLIQSGIPFKSYLGVDLVPEMIEHARAQQPDADLLAADLFGGDPLDRTFDAIYCSGVFNLRTDANLDYLKSVIPVFHKFIRTNGTVVLNFLHHRTPKQYDHCFYYNPQEVTALLKPFFNTITLKEDYLVNDFTLAASDPR